MPAAALAQVFDWAELDREVRAWLRDVTDRVRATGRRHVAGMVVMGRLVDGVKRRLPHGSFQAWVRAELPFGPRTATYLMQVGRLFPTVSLFPDPGVGEDVPVWAANVDPTALVAVASPSCPPAVRDRVLSLAEAGERVTFERARAWIDEALDRLPPRNRGEAVMIPQEDYIDRLDAMIDRGVVEVVADYTPVERVRLTGGELALLQRELFKEQFAGGAGGEPEPVDAPPGSAAKVAALARRRERGEPLFGGRDPDPARDGRAVVAVKRCGGGGRVVGGKRLPPPPRVLGWGDAR